METMKIEVPDDLARELEAAAASRHKTVEEIAAERLRRNGQDPRSPRVLLEALRSLPQVSTEAADEFESAIAAGRRPVGDGHRFDR